MTLTLLQVALGGALGSCLRYLATLGAARLFGTGFPWGTALVNVTGSLLMGVLAVALLERSGARFAPLLMTGVLGGFTTFSAFSLDSVSLIDRGQVGLALAYVLGSVVLSLIALIAGMTFARGVLG